MRFPRLRFSIRTLLIVVSVFGALLGLSIRFYPHVIFKIYGSPGSTGAVLIPTAPLVATTPDEVLVKCQIGPISFEMPEAMSRDITVLPVGFVRFGDEERGIRLQLPWRDVHIFQHELVRFPDKTKLTYSRLYQEILAVEPSDFSWSMTHQELQWHQWLLAKHALVDKPVDSVEYLWRPDLEGNLHWFPSYPAFQWSTMDCNWYASIYFQGVSPGDHDWIRHLCKTFVIEGDPGMLKGRQAGEIESLIRITKLE